jgi:hypothetical protein
MATGDHLLDAVTADTVASEAKRAARNSLPIGTPCPNCNTALAGAWCYQCGQRGEEYHRSILRLAGEAVMGLFDLDGRIWQTFPRLVLRPGKLTRDYLDGHRAVQVPPFRIFLIVLLMVFFAGNFDVTRNHQKFKLAGPDSPEAAKVMTFYKSENLDAELGDINASKWLKERLEFSLSHQDAFFAAVASWGQRFAVLMLPIAALMLSVLFLLKKNVYVFDHLIFSMHSLSFQGTLLTGVFLLGGLGVTSGPQLLWLSPIHLFVHMRGAYRISTLGTLIRMFLLFVGSTVAFALLIAGLVLVGLAAAH